MIENRMRVTILPNPVCFVLAKRNPGKCFPLICLNLTNIFCNLLVRVRTTVRRILSNGFLVIWHLEIPVTYESFPLGDVEMTIRVVLIRQRILLAKTIGKPNPINKSRPILIGAMVDDGTSIAGPYFMAYPVFPASAPSFLTCQNRSPSDSQIRRMQQSLYGHSLLNIIKLLLFGQNCTWVIHALGTRCRNKRTPVSVLNTLR